MATRKSTMFHCYNCRKQSFGELIRGIKNVNKVLDKIFDFAIVAQVKIANPRF